MGKPGNKWIDCCLATLFWAYRVVLEGLGHPGYLGAPATSVQEALGARGYQGGRVDQGFLGHPFVPEFRGVLKDQADQGLPLDLKEMRRGFALR